MTGNEVWTDKYLKLKEDKAVVKLYRPDDTFIKSIIIPTVQYPLNGEYKAFHSGNASVVEDARVIDIFNKQEYNIGRCYTNTASLVNDLKAAGYNAKSYAGWLFIGENQLPVHHCWAVLDDHIVLDLADDFTVLYKLNGDMFEEVKSMEKYQELVADFVKESKKQPHAVRCAPLGVPSEFLLYIGCECEPDKAAQIYRNLIKEFPKHECQRNCDVSGMNRIQRKLASLGLMPVK